MTEKDLVQEALQQMKNLEDVVQENAKGILGATMAQEISELVKESLIKETKKKESMEQGEDEMPDDTDDMDDTMDSLSPEGDDDDLGADDDDVDSMGMSPDSMMGAEDDDVIDATGLDGEKLWNLFKKIDPNKDQILVQNDGDNIHIKDDENDVEYILRMNEGYDDVNEDDYSSVDDVYSDIFSEDMGYDLEEDEAMGIEDVNVDMFNEDMGYDPEETVYEITMDEDMDEDMDENLYEDMDEDLDEDMDEDMDETIYEITMDEDMDEDLDEDMDEDLDEMYDEGVNEAKYMIKPVMGKMKNKGEAKENKTMKSAMKGLKKGEAKEGNYMSKPTKPTTQTKVDGYKKETLPEKGISNVVKKETKESSFIKKPKGVGMKPGQKKFEYKEASRTYGNGSKEGRGLRKGITPNRNFVYENEVLQQEVEVLKEKNEEYRKALNVFREKLNEVAVFNSNLAYATRLFTEHSTSKTEKINILRRFDDVETLKESKALYSSIKNELSQTTNNKVVTESIERKIEKTASTGSATNLIESKTYENPQFLRMKDLMGKLQK